MLLHWLLESEYRFSGAFCFISAFIVVLVISAIHELYEFAGVVLLGEGDGVLFIGAGDIDQWDAQKDMLNNMIGGAIGVSSWSIFNKG